MDRAIADFKILTKRMGRQAAIREAARRHEIDHYLLAEEMARRSKAKREAQRYKKIMASHIRENDRERIDRIQNNGFAIPDEAKEIGIDPSEVL